MQYDHLGANDRGEENFSSIRNDFRKINCTEILSSPLDVQKNIVNIWTRS